MSVPYLNRGESIVLTTHRVSVGSVLYDAMLTNQRLILMDNTSDNSEPEIIPFSEIVTVKGGKASTGEPAIILTLAEPNNFSDSGQASLIFTQNPGEKRKHERELWVKKLIELVIKAREEDSRSRVAPLEKKSGLQPSVRRWEAPEPVRPHSSAAEPAPPEPIVITEQEPDPLEFFLEEKARHTPADDQAPAKPEEPSATSVSPPEPIDTEPGSEIPLKKMIAPEDLFAGIHIAPPSPVPAKEQEPLQSQQEPAKPYESREQFDRIVHSVAESLQKREDMVPEPEPGPVKEQVVRTTSPLPDPRADDTSAPLPVILTPGEIRELPGTYNPEIPAPVARKVPRERKPPVKEVSAKKDVIPRRPYALAAVIVIIAIIVLTGGVVIAINYLQGSAYSDTIVTFSPSPPVTQNTVATLATEQNTGIRVVITYPHAFIGTMGNPGFLHPISGTGDHTYPVIMTSSIVQAAVQKTDNSGDPLTVEIYNNSTRIASRTVTAPGADINLLIDTKTAIPPGLNPKATSTTDTLLLGNGSLIYY